MRVGEHRESGAPVPGVTPEVVGELVEFVEFEPDGAGPGERAHQWSDGLDLHGPGTGGLDSHSDPLARQRRQPPQLAGRNGQIAIRRDHQLQIQRGFAHVVMVAPTRTRRRADEDQHDRRRVRLDDLEAVRPGEPDFDGYGPEDTVEVSVELMSGFDADVILLATLKDAPADPTVLQVLSTTVAARSDQVFQVDSNVWTFVLLQGQLAVLDDIERLFTGRTIATGQFR